MSYCSKLFVVEKTNVFEDCQKRYARVIAMFDMGQILELSDVLRKQKETDCLIYADDGDTEILEDCYGKPLTESTLAEVIDILQNDVKLTHEYRRVFPVLSAFGTYYFQEQKGLWHNLVVLHYGY